MNKNEMPSLADADADIKDRLIDLLARAIDCLPINEFAAFDPSLAEHMTDAAEAIDPRICECLRDAFRDNIEEYRY